MPPLRATPQLLVMTMLPCTSCITVKRKADQNCGNAACQVIAAITRCSM